MRIIASMTTIPSRIALIRPAIESLLRQNMPIESVEINIPFYCHRTQESYELPSWLETMDRVRVFRTDDFGPITKIAPTLLRHSHDDNVYIWSADDDFIYPPNQLEMLCHCHDPSQKRILTRHGGVIQPD